MAHTCTHAAHTHARTWLTGGALHHDTVAVSLQLADAKTQEARGGPRKQQDKGASRRPSCPVSWDPGTPRGRGILMLEPGNAAGGQTPSVRHLRGSGSVFVSTYKRSCGLGGRGAQYPLVSPGAPCGGRTRNPSDHTPTGVFVSACPAVRSQGTRPARRRGGELPGHTVRSRPCPARTPRPRWRHPAPRPLRLGREPAREDALTCFHRRELHVAGGVGDVAPVFPPSGHLPGIQRVPDGSCREEEQPDAGGHALWHPPVP